MKLLQILILLFTLTLATFSLVYFKAPFFIVFILFLLKFLIVALYFMELKTSHVFWKTIILIYVSVLTISIFIF